MIARGIAEKYRTAYGKGMCGQVISEKSVKAIAKYYPDWYNSHAALLKSEYGAFGFDCVCLVKSILGVGTATRTHSSAVLSISQTTSRT